VVVNESLISQQLFEDTLSEKASGFNSISTRAVSDGTFAGKLETSINAQGGVLARFTEISLNEAKLTGEAFFVQEFYNTFYDGSRTYSIDPADHLHKQRRQLVDQGSKRDSAQE